jgi:peptide/nickel transport system permease protein
VVFMILNITPADPATIMLGIRATQAEKDQLNHELGLDKPVLDRFVTYLDDAVQLDFGKSYRSGKPVFKDLISKFPITLELALLSMIFATVLGIPLGILSAVKQYSVLDVSLTVSSLLLASIPAFWFSLLLILALSLSLRLLPSSGIGNWKYFVMPVLTLSLPNAAFLARMTRTTMIETMRQDYIRTAKAKGAGRQRIIWKHAIKNALMPVITLMGMTFAMLLGGTMITEVVFGMPGIGSAIIVAISMKDTPFVMASTIFLATLFLVIMLVVDISYAYLDPRIRAEFK